MSIEDLARQVRQAKRTVDAAQAHYKALMAVVNQRLEPEETVIYADDDGEKHTVKLIRTKNDRVDLKGLSSVLDRSTLMSIGHVEVNVAELEQAALMGVVPTTFVDRFVVRGYRTPFFREVTGA